MQLTAPARLNRPSEGHIRISPSSETLQLLLLTHLNMYTEPVNKHRVMQISCKECAMGWNGCCAIECQYNNHMLALLSHML